MTTTEPNETPPEQPEERDIVLDTENALRKAEGVLEAIGRSICDVPGSAPAHGHIDVAVSAVQQAIHECWRMGPEP